MIYADYNSTSPILPEVKEAMIPFLEKEFGNPSSASGDLGRRAKAAIEEARWEIAALIGSAPDEVVFTSGATESCFLGLLGAALANPKIRNIVCSSVEHSAVLSCVDTLSRPPFSLIQHRLRVSSDGSLIQEEAGGFEQAIVSLMLANNETGILFPVSEVVSSFRSYGCFSHCDATQAVGKLPVDFATLGVDLLSFSGHKLGAPKGIGALVIKGESKWTPPMIGGGQERGLRGGTEAVASIVGLGVAAKIAKKRLSENTSSIKRIRDLFEHELSRLISDIRINGAICERLSNTSNIEINNISALELVTKLAHDEIYISTGSACSAGKFEPSHVLLAMGRTTTSALSTIRVSFGCDSTEDDATELAAEIAAITKLVRERTSSQLSKLLS